MLNGPRHQRVSDDNGRVNNELKLNETRNDETSSALFKALPVILIGIAWLLRFWPMMLGSTICGFRDSAYLYYPYFKWIDSVWASGEIPLWNPYCGAGYPLVADGSSSLFYPGKLIFFCRFLSYESRYGIYLAVHVLIAAATSYWMARRFGAGAIGATLAGMSYAFGGSVLFQTTNVIYLVSAAWLPAALVCIWMLQEKNEFRWAVLGGVFCSLMILGGDPHTVFHVGLVGLAGVLGHSYSCWLGRSGPPEMERLERDKADPFSSLAKLSILVAVTTVLAAIQLVPSMQRAESSIRSEYELPRTAYEVPGFSVNEIGLGLFGTPVAGSHHDHLYQFSQPPWTLVELIYPNASGQPFPLHTRWTDSIPGSDRMWALTLYAGCLTFVLAMFAFRLWGRKRKQVWISRMICFFAVGSFGWYGLGWLLHEVFGPAILPDVGAPTGGLYWMMVVGLPKYVTFRYPAKLFVFAALGLSVLAGLRLDQVICDRLKMMRTALVLIALAVLGFILVNLLNNGGLLDRVPGDPLFGPFQKEDCVAKMYLNAIQVLLVGAGIFAVVMICFRRHEPDRNNVVVIGIIVLLIALADLFSANYGVVPEVNRLHYLDKGLQLPVSESVDAAPPVIDFQARYASPGNWKDSASLLRLQAVFSNQENELMAKHHLQYPAINYNSFASVESREEANFYEGKTERLPALACLGDAAGPSSGVRLATSLGSREEFLSFSANRFVIRVKPRAGENYLHVQQFYHDGWRARIIEDDGAIKNVAVQSAEHPFLRVQIPNRECTVEFEFRPPRFFAGAWISGLAWATLMFVGLVWLVHAASVKRARKN